MCRVFDDQGVDDRYTFAGTMHQNWVQVDFRDMLVTGGGEYRKFLHEVEESLHVEAGATQQRGAL
jgi:hypothetical protein